MDLSNPDVPLAECKSIFWCACCRINADSRYCDTCGGKTKELPADRYVICENCSCLHKVGRRFCPDCGIAVVAPAVVRAKEEIAVVPKEPSSLPRNTTVAIQKKSLQDALRDLTDAEKKKIMSKVRLAGYLNSLLIL